MQYYYYSKEELIAHSKLPIVSAKDNDEIFNALADEMIAIISENNQLDQPTVIICPVGPVGHYSYFVSKVNEQQLSLKNVWFINMDEYLDDHQQWIDINHRLSFRGFMNREVYSKIDAELVMPETQRVFPDPNNLTHIPTLIEQLGKVDACFGGIGINGHVAFNEPDGRLSNEDFLALPTRVLEIDPMTVAVNAVGDLQGAIEMMPKWCVTIGMREINAAKKIRLGVFREWHRSVLRRAVCGVATPEFPVTLLQNHPNIRVYASDFVLNHPLG
ncbi:MAG: glucosamine-6-phosphate isomerase [Aerococcaceae bacterium]|nr:glucosamine-6-phosphate isomerase [Aerococcaceae bacterium]